MNTEILSQRSYWNSEAAAFQAIYTHQKSALANVLDRVFRRDMYERFVFTTDHAAPIRGRTFLDVGCGSGLYSVELARRGAARVVGLDIAESMIELSRAAAVQGALDRICTFQQTDLLEYRTTRTFDVSIGIGLFDYIRDPLPVLRRMHELTSDKAILSFPRLWTWRAPIRKLRLAWRGCPVFFYTKRRVTALLRAAGFQDVRVTRVGKLHCVVALVTPRRRPGAHPTK